MIRLARWGAILFLAAAALFGAGCMAGVVSDDATGQPVQGATIRYTDSAGVIRRTHVDGRGVYTFDPSSAPAPGPITVEVRAPGYQTLTATRVVDYGDNPAPAPGDPSSFWELQDFKLKPLPPVNGSDLEAADTMWLPPYHGNGELQLWVRNNGPLDVAGVSGRINCAVDETDVATGSVRRFSTQTTVTINLTAGGATTYPTGAFTHTNVSSYEVSCTVTAPTNDPDLPNNTFIVQIPSDAPPGG
jgi:hypothetical protein